MTAFYVFLLACGGGVKEEVAMGLTYNIQRARV